MRRHRPARHSIPQMPPQTRWPLGTAAFRELFWGLCEHCAPSWNNVQPSLPPTGAGRVHTVPRGRRAECLRVHHVPGFSQQPGGPPSQRQPHGRKARAWSRRLRDMQGPTGAGWQGTAGQGHRHRAGAGVGEEPHPRVSLTLSWATKDPNQGPPLK